jgi:nitrite reductase (NADH) small subunit
MEPLLGRCMTVAVLDAREHNTVFLGDDRYFVLEDDGRLFVVEDKCPHRGGPLSLGRRTTDERLVCPWHGSRITCAYLRRTSIPIVRRGSEITAYLPGDNGVHPVFLAKRRILANTEGGGA